MSEIKKLIERLCPDGVEWEKLVDNVDVLYGYPFDSRLFCEDETFMPLIRIRDVKPAKASTYYSGEVIEEYRITKGDILVGMDGNFNLEKWNDVDGLLNQRVCKLSSKNEDKILNGFIYHYLKPVFKSIEGELNSGTVIHLSAKRINKIEIPVPPIEVQTKIVEILDNFTELEAELEAKLEAELEARRKQYEYYRNQLLTFDKVGGARFDVKWMKLGEIASFTYGYTDKAQEIGNARFIRITDIDDMGNLHMDNPKYVTMTEESKKYLLKNGDLLMARTGATYGKTLYVSSDEPAVYASFLIKVAIDQSILLNRYYWHFSKSSLYWRQADKLVSKGGQQQFNTNAIGRVLVPVPPLSEQQRIVSILDRFEALTTDLQSGLPAEIEARRKQYEYYREKLLTFKRKSA